VNWAPDLDQGVQQSIFHSFAYEKIERGTMETLYFLIFIGLCAGSLILFILKSSNKPKKRVTKQQQNIWNNRRQHAHSHPSFTNKTPSKGTGNAYTVSASKIHSDGEIDPEAETDEDNTLREIEYHSVDTGYTKQSNTKR
jgi:hypothetical protein